MAVIPKPDAKLISNALHYAETLREIDDDHHGVAHVLLYLVEYSRHLKAVTDAAEQYITFAQDAECYIKLSKSLEMLATYEHESQTLVPPKFSPN